MQVNIPTRNALKAVSNKWTKFFSSKFVGSIMDVSLVRKTSPFVIFQQPCSWLLLAKIWKMTKSVTINQSDFHVHCYWFYTVLAYQIYSIKFTVSEPTTWLTTLHAKNIFLVLTLSWRKSLSYSNQSINLPCKSVDWFLYDRDLRHGKGKFF